MTNLVYALGYARTEYENMRNAITGLCTEFGVSSLPELKTVIDRRPTVEDVKSLEQRAAQMTMEIGRLRELVKLKDTELGKTRTLMEAAHQDVVRIAGMCEVPATTMLNSNLYEAGISQSEVFKSETFKKFLKSTMAYTKRIEESNKTVVAVLESVRSRISEAGPRPAPTFESPAKVPVSRLSPAQLQRTGAGPSNPTTPTDKGKGPSGEERTPPTRTVDSPAKNTRSVVRNLGAEAWERSPAGTKLHDQGGILLSDEEELESDPSHPDTDAVASEEEYDLVDGKRVRIGRIAATPLKRPRPAPPRPQFGHSSAK
jgi:hypothetical protein